MSSTPVPLRLPESSRKNREPFWRTFTEWRLKRLIKKKARLKRVMDVLASDDGISDILKYEEYSFEHGQTEAKIERLYARLAQG